MSKPNPADQFIDGVMNTLKALGFAILGLGAGYFATATAYDLAKAATKPWEPSTGLRGAVALSLATIAVLGLVVAWRRVVK